jgi:kynureninase
MRCSRILNCLHWPEGRVTTANYRTTQLPAADYSSLAASLDDGDVLARFRREFFLQPGQIYLDGNSLGLASVRAEAAVLKVLHDWKTMAIKGWTKAPLPWLSLTEKIAGLLAPLVGADPQTIAVGNSTTVNLHQLLTTLFEPGQRRNKVLVDALSFPSNLYAIQSHLRCRGLDPDKNLVTVDSRDGCTISEADIIAAFTDEIQIAVLPSVLFQSGQLLDLKLLTAEAHARGILIGFDCSHSVGVVPQELDAWGTDFAYWCTYKYLNSGPGGTAALYLNARHFDRSPGLAGWFGSRKDRQFAFAPDFEPAPTAQKLEIATPNIFSIAPLLGSLEQINEAGIQSIREKSLRLTELLIELFDQLLAGYGFKMITPREPHRRGGHISLTHPEAARICSALRDTGIITDFRPPAVIRITPSPLYVSFSETLEAVYRIRQIVENRTFDSQASLTHVI